MRLIVDPLKQLRPAERGTIRLSGVRDAESRLYRFGPLYDGPSPDAGG